MEPYNPERETAGLPRAVAVELLRYRQNLIDRSREFNNDDWLATVNEVRDAVREAGRKWNEKKTILFARRLRQRLQFETDREHNFHGAVESAIAALKAPERPSKFAKREAKPGVWAGGDPRAAKTETSSARTPRIDRNKVALRIVQDYAMNQVYMDLSGIESMESKCVAILAHLAASKGARMIMHKRREHVFVPTSALMYQLNRDGQQMSEDRVGRLFGGLGFTTGRVKIRGLFYRGVLVRIDSDEFRQLRHLHDLG